MAVVHKGYIEILNSTGEVVGSVGGKHCYLPNIWSKPVLASNITPKRVFYLTNREEATDILHEDFFAHYGLPADYLTRDS